MTNKRTHNPEKMHFNFAVSFSSTMTVCGEDHISIGAACIATPKSQQVKKSIREEICLATSTQQQPCMHWK